jgi:hypothetical protein
VRSRVTLCVTLSLGLSLCEPRTRAQETPPQPASSSSCAEIETFLKTAKIGRERGIPVGATLPSRATLDDGRMRHDASIQTVDVTLPVFSNGRGTQLDFRDSWQFNVAGYELAKILGLNMVPPYVERRVRAGSVSLSWWVSGTMMERERFLQKISPPEAEPWNQQIAAARVFHQLIGDSDFNMTNVLITRDWRVWMIDFSRAFRRATHLRDQRDLTRIDRRLLANLRGLTRDVLRQKLKRWLKNPEIDALLARRDRIVEFFDGEVAAKGEARVLYDFPRTAEPCGAGLR